VLLSKTLNPELLATSGFDDLSASVEMKAYPGPPPPSPPPAPPGTVCGCYPTPVEGVCASGTTLTEVSVTNNASVPIYQQCIYAPQYDLFLQVHNITFVEGWCLKKKHIDVACLKFINPIYS
jgi:hypothetical protein